MCIYMYYLNFLFVFQICDKVLSCRGGLTKHMARHSSVKPFICELCGKGVSSRSHLVDHMRRHTGERPYKCTIEVCSYCFFGLVMVLFNVLVNILVISGRSHRFLGFNVSTVSDKNNHTGVNFRKFTGAIAFCCFDKISKFNFAENFMHKTKC